MLNELEEESEKRLKSQDADRNQNVPLEEPKYTKSKRKNCSVKPIKKINDEERKFMVNMR